MIALLLACSTSVRCPDGMVAAQGEGGPFCIHAWEIRAEPLHGVALSGVLRLADPARVRLVSAPGHVPDSASWEQAVAACQHNGWRLCTSAEWTDACDGVPGAGGADFPTLDGALRPGVCAFSEGDDGRQPLSKTGAHPDCVTPTGIADMAGNLWEWSDPGGVDAFGRPLTDKRGGAHYGGRAVPCGYTSVGKQPTGFYASVGFRCCVDPL